MDYHKLGRRAIKTDSRTLRLARYLTAELPAPAPSLDYTKGITSYGQMLNNELGDCTIAGLGHAIQTWTANTAKEVTVTDATVLAGYENFCGYNPADPSTDQGGIELDVLNDWKNQGFGGYPLHSFVSANPRNTRQLKQAIGLFGGVYIGMGLPISAQNQIGSVWDVVRDDGTGNTVPGSWGGHAVWCPKYDGTNKELDYVTCITWGGLQKMSTRFWLKYVDECYGLLSAAWINAVGGAPNGFNLAQLEADLAAIH